MDIYNKLVRDRIPEIIKAEGRLPVTRILETTEYLAELRKKLSEEVEEYLSSGETEELADILEVVLALARRAGVDQPALESLRLEKRLKRGGFDERVFLEGAKSTG